MLKDKAYSGDSWKEPIQQKSKLKQALGELQNPHKKDAHFVPKPPVFHSHDFVDLSALEAEADELFAGRKASLHHSELQARVPAKCVTRSQGFEISGNEEPVSEASDEESEAVSEYEGKESNEEAYSISRGEEEDVGSEDGKDSTGGDGEDSMGEDAEVSDDEEDPGEESDAHNASKDETFHTSEDEGVSGASGEVFSWSYEETQNEGSDISRELGESDKEAEVEGEEEESNASYRELEVSNKEPLSHEEVEVQREEEELSVQDEPESRSCELEGSDEKAEVQREMEESNAKDEPESSYPLPGLLKPPLRHPMLSTTRPVASFPPKPSTTKSTGPLFSGHHAMITRPAVPIIDPPAHNPELPKKKQSAPSFQPKEDTFKVGYQSRKVIQQIQQVEVSCILLLTSLQLIPY